jgi:glycosyltransferase involved in cell wall biosynthesis
MVNQREKYEYISKKVFKFSKYLSFDVMSTQKLKYVIITPVKNEEKYIGDTIDSVCNQVLKPSEWIIVDDGSVDDTAKIVEKYSKEHSWIKLIKKTNYSETRSGGSKVVRAFETGFNNLSEKDYDFIAKIDADIILPDYYFDVIANEFLSDKKVGICGGVCVIEENGKLIVEKAAEYHIRGALKSYRRECFEEIGGIKPVYSWDVIDEFLAMYFGWKLKRLTNLKAFHHRETGAETGQFLYSIRMGDFCYKIGYDPFLAILRALKRTFDAKNVVYGFGILVGYVKAIPSKKLLQKEHRKFVREFQYRRFKKEFKSLFSF